MISDSKLSIALGSVISSSGSNGFTRAQIVTLAKLNNLVNDHLTEGDFSGTELDLQGKPVPKPGGGTWNHLEEMNNAYDGLKSVQKGLEGTLKNPNIDPVTKQHIQDALTKTNTYITKIEKLYNKYNNTPGGSSGGGRSRGSGGSTGSGGISPIMPVNPTFPDIPIFEPIPLPFPLFGL